MEEWTTADILKLNKFTADFQNINSELENLPQLKAQQFSIALPRQLILEPPQALYNCFHRLSRTPQDKWADLYV